MKHAGGDALDRLEPLLSRVRKFDGLKEKKPGTFYRAGRAFLHFHEDPKGFFADVRLDEDFIRFEVTTRSQQSNLVTKIRERIGDRD